MPLFLWKLTFDKMPQGVPEVLSLSSHSAASYILLITF